MRTMGMMEAVKVQGRAAMTYSSTSSLVPAPPLPLPLPLLLPLPLVLALRPLPPPPLALAGVLVGVLPAPSLL